VLRDERLDAEQKGPAAQSERHQESKHRIQTLQECKRKDKSGKSEEAAAPQQEDHVNLFAKEEREDQAHVRGQTQEQKHITGSSITPIFLDGSNQKGEKSNNFEKQSMNENDNARNEWNPMQSFVRSTPTVSSARTSSTALVVLIKR
jgi:hypothetical protein